jgi:UDP-N-acetylglucosamine 3-dehydrogenase
MNVGIIGCGGMGTLHAQCARAAGLNVAVCADTNPSKAEELGKAVGAEHTSDCMGAVRRPDLDVVAVTTPTPTHTTYVTAAARAGKHVFCEKPFGRTVEQCREAIAEAEKAGVKLFVAHVVRYFQEFDLLKAQIEAGAVGDAGFLKMYRGGIMPRGENLWFRDYEQSGGVVLDSCIHDYDWLRYVFGPAERVYCQALMRPDAINYALTTFRMKSGLIALVIGSWAHPSGFRVKVEVCGKKGMLTFDSDVTPISVSMREAAGAAPGMIVPSSPVPKSPYQLEWEDFLGWINGDHTPRVRPEEGLEAVRTALAALDSAKTGKAVTLE